MSLFGGDSIWDTAAENLFFTHSGVAKLLEAGGDECTVEALLKEDEIIQEAQSQSPALIEFLTRPVELDRLLSYLVVPQPPGAPEDSAYRFPYMAAEVLACAVPPLLDALVASPAHLGDGAGVPRHRRRAAPHLDTLFSLALPDLARPPAAASQLAAPQPYLLAYWCKSVTVVARHRPAALLRYLDATPGLAASLLGRYGQHGIVAALISRLLALPWHPASRPPRAALCLARGDATPAAGADDGAAYGLAPGSVPDLLIRAVEVAVVAAAAGAATATAATDSDATEPALQSLLLPAPSLDADGSGPASSPSHRTALAVALTSRARHAADILGAALALARADTPHAKYAAPGYNAATLQRRVVGGGGVGAAHEEDGGEPPVAAAVALSAANTQLDASYWDAAVRAADSFNLRLLKSVRDAPSGAARLVGAASTCIRALSEVEAAAGDPSALSAAAEAACSALCVALDAAAVAYRQQVVLDFRAPLPANGGGEDDGGAGAGSGAVALGAVPAVVAALLPQLPAFTAYLAARVAAATATSTTEPAPPPSSPSAPRLGMAGLAVVRVLAATVRCGWPAVATAAVRARVLPTLLDALVAFPWHSVLHRAVGDAVGDALATGAEWGAGLRRALLFDAALLTRVAGGCRVAAMPRGAAAAAGLGVGAARTPLPPGVTAAAPRGGVGAPAAAPVGYAGHLLAMANTVLSLWARGGAGDGSEGSGGGADAPAPPLLRRGAPPPLSSAPLRALLASHSEWWDAVDGQLALANVAAGLLLGGALAPDVKKSGQVGANADATGSGGGAAARGGAGGGAVDEVAALELKSTATEGGGESPPPPGAGGGRSGYGSSDDEEEEDETGRGEYGGEGTRRGAADGSARRRLSGGGVDESTSTPPATVSLSPSSDADSDDDDDGFDFPSTATTAPSAAAASHAAANDGFDFPTSSDFPSAVPTADDFAADGAGAGTNGPPPAAFDDFTASSTSTSAWDDTPFGADGAFAGGGGVVWEVGDGGRLGDNDGDVGLLGGGGSGGPATTSESGVSAAARTDSAASVSSGGSSPRSVVGEDEDDEEGGGGGRAPPDVGAADVDAVSAVAAPSAHAAPRSPDFAALDDNDDDDADAGAEVEAAAVGAPPVVRVASPPPPGFTTAGEAAWGDDLGRAFGAVGDGSGGDFEQWEAPAESDDAAAAPGAGWADDVAFEGADAAAAVPAPPAAESSLPADWGFDVK